MSRTSITGSAVEPLDNLSTGGSLVTSAVVARDAFRGKVEIVSDKKESIHSATRLAYDCAKNGMANEWVPPPTGTIKVNVHGGISSFPFPRGNAFVVGIILRDEEGSLLCNLLGTIPNLNLAAKAIQLWAIFNGMCLAFERGFINIHPETDNLLAFYLMKNSRDGVLEELHNLVQQIDMMRRDPRWTISIFLIYPRCNTASIYHAHLGGQLDRLYILNVVSVCDLDEYLAMDMDLLGDFNIGLDIDNEDEEVVKFPKAGEIPPGGARIVELHHAIFEDEIID
ncbi:hypothetical protein POM88_015493 [Heracleum sosnowskyi]|uniref:RNase H type-1 domain-containing protein n=1 Tax=Heracleum sosnowskyi TaxID=360622 RepID=A0AAD8MS54_9APIA|nr:hypothetical protein POM88_015493 [Heracleum sosnowskyi]